MHDVNICLVASFFDHGLSTRQFISSSSDIYNCPTILLQNDRLSLTEHISKFLYDVTNVVAPETIYTQLIMAKKHDPTHLDLVYSVRLPSDIQLKESEFFLQSYNIAIIHPYVRKAIQYI
jgi:hypothetical protein